MELQELEQKYAELGKAIEELKAKQNYPIYCLSTTGNGFIVKFDQLTSGTVVKQYKYDDVGYSCNYWVEHTNPNNWQQLEVCEKTGFYDGQLVWCWDKDDTHQRVLRFYNVKNKCIFTHDGGRNGYRYDNYEPFKGNWPEWAQEAFKTLKY